MPAGLLTRFLPYIIGAAALVAVYFGWQYHQREIGRQEIIAKDAKELAAQKERDAKLSADLVDELRAKLNARDATVQPVKERIIRVATECSKSTGPDAGAAAVWVRDALSETGRPAARP